MMAPTRRLTMVVVAVAAALFTLSCSSDNSGRQRPPIAADRTTVALETAPTSPIGGTLEIWSEGFAVGLSEYTVANLRTDPGGYRIDVAIHTRQGECIPGSFFVLTDAGNKIEAADPSSRPPGGIDLSGSLIAGEKRQGFLTFPVASGESVTKVILYHGTINPPKAFWTA